jgi:hypothetical protein
MSAKGYYNGIIGWGPVPRCYQPAIVSSRFSEEDLSHSIDLRSAMSETVYSRITTVALDILILLSGR